MAKSKPPTDPLPADADPTDSTDQPEGVLRLWLWLVDKANEVLEHEQKKRPPGQRRKLRMSDLFSPILKPVILARHAQMEAEKEAARRRGTSG